MSRKSEAKEAADQKPTNKANMDQPQEEFIAPQSSHAERDEEDEEKVSLSAAVRSSDGQRR